MHIIQIQTSAAAHAATDPQTLASVPIIVLTADHPELQPILDGFGLDTCCGGHLTLVEACAEHGLDPAPIAKALLEALQPPGVNDGYHPEGD
jgi:iron-sulfur cluster repair protein YtfE (RIC family)